MIKVGFHKYVKDIVGKLHTNFKIKVTLRQYNPITSSSRTPAASYTIAATLRMLLMCIIVLFLVGYVANCKVCVLYLCTFA